MRCNKCGEELILKRVPRYSKLSEQPHWEGDKRSMKTEIWIHRYDVPFIEKHICKGDK